MTFIQQECYLLKRYRKKKKKSKAVVASKESRAITRPCTTVWELTDTQISFSDKSKDKINLYRCNLTYEWSGMLANLKLLFLPLLSEFDYQWDCQKRLLRHVLFQSNVIHRGEPTANWQRHPYCFCRSQDALPPWLGLSFYSWLGSQDLVGTVKFQNLAPKFCLDMLLLNWFLFTSSSFG